jgi:hypothetical protein
MQGGFFESLINYRLESESLFTLLKDRQQSVEVLINLSLLLNHLFILVTSRMVLEQRTRLQRMCTGT